MQPSSVDSPSVGVTIEFEEPDVTLVAASQQARLPTERADFALQGLESVASVAAAHLDEGDVRVSRHAGRVAEAGGGAW